VRREKAHVFSSPAPGTVIRCGGPRTFARPIVRSSPARNEVSSTRGALCTDREGWIGRPTISPACRRASRRARSSRSGAVARAFPESYAARLSETVGRYRAPQKNSTLMMNRSPGCPAMSVRGPAQGERRGQRLRGSMRGRRLAGRNRRYASFGVLPSSIECGRCSLYEVKRWSSCRWKSVRRCGTRILRVHSTFMVLILGRRDDVQHRWLHVPRPTARQGGSGRIRVLGHRASRVAERRLIRKDIMVHRPRRKDRWTSTPPAVRAAPSALHRAGPHCAGRDCQPTRRSWRRFRHAAHGADRLMAPVRRCVAQCPQRAAARYPGSDVTETANAPTRSMAELTSRDQPRGRGGSP
jgi:hypothetical protein